MLDKILTNSNGVPENVPIHMDVYRNPNPEQQILNELYHVIQDCYSYVMAEGPNEWVGYNSGLGFNVPMDVLSFYEPSLQRILSLLNIELSDKKISINEASVKLAACIKALGEFDLQKDIIASERDNFTNSRAQEYIDNVKDALQKALVRISQ